MSSQPESLTHTLCSCLSTSTSTSTSTSCVTPRDFSFGAGLCWPFSSLPNPNPPVNPVDPCPTPLVRASSASTRQEQQATTRTHHARRCPPRGRLRRRLTGLRGALPRRCLGRVPLPRGDEHAQGACIVEECVCESRIEGWSFGKDKGAGGVRGKRVDQLVCQLSRHIAGSVGRSNAWMARGPVVLDGRGDG